MTDAAELDEKHRARIRKLVSETPHALEKVVCGYFKDGKPWGYARWYAIDEGLPIYETFKEWQERQKR